MKLPHALHIYSSGSVYVLVFFKVMRQQTLGEGANAIIRLWADNVCLQQ